MESLSTAPRDERFPHTNQTRNCWVRYVEWKLCEEKHGEEESECKKFGRWARALCPVDWIERWDEQRANGTFPGPSGESS
ncbi:cytochrome c oxidase subunit VIb [Cyanidioschyzon merolae strain 10D]|jgi:cytochrome c oxidase subunit 6b|uniref:Cytochrome c oxidase subunit VIb n=1 Tax=Cyanidioschyzon merolae (strain NIES-3377 / 10D) TaxID=280699 RepID=M1VBC9_CYAM1|nr:cytochrome c oxidase subunit VIb [Cyanidioschyzon merolae strain 10D]BAM82589.1 cytochrome c oxidase subunit VIb [Cyanidioschyzon merolae strain 10D]|eukprot:XP_005538625.1 cytochrome c oxidase subunit VIb [Cyanidioschyzon merolae strain 10D]